jgi:hypothetical protein
MKVQHAKKLEPHHSLEIGGATWDENSVSIRNRYDLADGRFSPRQSSEFPIDDLVDIVEFVSEVGALGKDAWVSIAKAALTALEKL